jgi:hypothetical protein
VSRPPPLEASSNQCFHALRILHLPAQASATSVPIDSSLCDLLHKWQPKEFKMPLIQHHRPPLQFQGSARRPPLDYKTASRMRLLHTAPPPITIRHPPRLIHRKDFHGQSTTSNTRCRTSYAYNFGFKPVSVSSYQSSFMTLPSVLLQEQPTTYVGDDDDGPLGGGDGDPGRPHQHKKC